MRLALAPDGGESAVAAVAAAGDAAAMSALSLEDLRRLCQTLAVELGLVPGGFQRYGHYADLRLTSTVLLRPRQVLIRMTLEAPARATLAALAAAAAEVGCADFLLVGAAVPVEPDVESSEHVLGPSAFMTLCRQSSMVGWADGRPVVRTQAYRDARRRAERLRELDTYGLAWLPALSRNRRPWSLRDSSVPADEWFERATFRTATDVFRMNGIRFGSAMRGQRVGDVLLWRDGQLVLLDCKAAQNGYKLEVDDERRLLDYASGRYPGYCETDRLSCVLLVSSAFPTFDANDRRFQTRRQRFRNIGCDLACIRADDLVDAALALLAQAEDTRIAAAVPWRRILSQGMVQRDRLMRYCRASAEAA